MTMYMYFHVNIFLVGIGIPLILNTKIKIDEIVIVAKYRKCSINLETNQNIRIRHGSLPYDRQ